MIRLLSPMPTVRPPPDQSQLDAAWAAVMALDVVGMPAAAVGRNGRAIAVNHRFKRLIPDGARKSADHLRLVGSAADGLIGDTLAQLASEGEREGSRLARPGSRQPLPFRVAGFAADRLGGLAARFAS